MARSKHVVLAVLMAAFFSTMVARLAISPVVPQLIADFSVSKTAIGAALTGMWAAVAVFQFPAGVLADRFGERRLVLAGLACTATGSLALAAAPTFPLLAAGAVLVGVGGGLYFPAGVAVIDRHFTNTGQALGFHLSGGDIAGVLTPVAVVAVAAAVGWRPAVALGAIAALPAIALIAWRLEAGDRGSPRGTLGPVLRDLRGVFPGLGRPGVAYTIGIASVLTFTFQAVISFYPTFLVEFWSVPTARAGTVFSGLFLLWIVFLPLTGRLADVTDRDLVLGGTTALIAVGMAVTVLAPSVTVAYLGTFLMGIGMSGGGVMDARILAAHPAADRTAGFGAARATAVFVASGGNVLTGWLADTAGWPAAYGVVAGLLALAVLALALNRLFRLGL